MKARLLVMLVVPACVTTTTVEGEVTIVDGPGPCLDDDYDPIKITVTATDIRGDVTDKVERECAGSYSLELAEGSHRIEAVVASPDPILGIYFSEDRAELMITVVEGEPLSLPPFVLSVD